ncbi:MAG TPA: hypothetical protein VFQ43_10050 [Nitrososphaera sp.]|nr:hypothetical protein [Nitrososphaera sp.]
MKRILFASLIPLFMAQLCAYGQFKTPYPIISERHRPEANTSISQTKDQADPGNEFVLAARIVAALKRLDGDVLVYRSLGDFEADGRLARVPFEVFKDNLQEVTTQVEPLLSQLSEGKLKAEISNALASYRDGEFWWQRVYQLRVVNVSAMSFVQAAGTPSDAVFLSTVPYTVAIHWRQASKYLKRAEELANRNK